MRYRLTPSSKPGKQLSKLVQSLGEDIELALVHAGNKPEIGIHQCRKRCKEARAVIRLVKPNIVAAQFEDYQHLYKSVANQLSGNRDALVRQKSWEALVREHPELEGTIDASIASFLRDKPQSSPDPGKESLFNLALYVDSQHKRLGSKQLPNSRAALATNLKRIYRKARDAEKQARRSNDIERFHQFRKRTKDLFYCLRILRPLLNSSVKDTVKKLENLTECQGLANDQAVLLAFLEQHQDELKLTDAHWHQAEGAINGKLSALQKQAHEAANPLLKPTPAKFIDSL